MGVEIGLTVLLVFYAALIGTLNPWCPLKKRDQLRHPVAIIAWWLWLGTLFFLLVLVWCPPFRAYLDQHFTNLAIRFSR
jgi:hypothetical protein